MPAETWNDINDRVETVLQSANVDTAINDHAARLDALTPAAANSQGTFVLTDDDNAASSGAAVYVVGFPDSYPARFVSNHGGSGSVFVASDVENVGFAIYKEADPAGTFSYEAQVYVDEDATDTHLRLLHANPEIGDPFTVMFGGRMLLVAYDPDAATKGVPLYFDHDATAGQRLLFVSPTDSDSLVQTHPTSFALQSISTPSALT